MKTQKALSDYHFHAFNKDVLTIRTLYLIAKAILFQDKGTEGGSKSGINFEMLRRIANFLRIGFERSSTEVFESLSSSYKDAGFKLDAATPLMFDVEYCFVEASDRSIHENVLSNVQDRFQLLFGENTNDEDFAVIQHFLNELQAERGSANLEGAVTKSFQNQIDEIVALRNKYPSVVFPFFAVDPRRSGVVDMAIQQLEQGNFFGIKLYAPNGYSPLDKELLKLYSYCEKNQVPITAHHSLGGFATFADKLNINGEIYDAGKIVTPANPVSFVPLFENGWVEDRARKLNHPMLWEKVLEQYPKLKLDLAHFGLFSNATQLDDRYAWTSYVAGLMKKYENLYTDLSCYTDINDIKYINSHFLTDPKVAGKVLYGSDYYLNMLFINTFKGYMQNFTTALGSNFDMLLANNAKFFAKIPQEQNR